MKPILQIGDKVKIKDTDFRGEIVGVGHNLPMFLNSDNEPVAMPGSVFIVRLRNPLLIMEYNGTYAVRDNHAPSSVPRSLCVHDIVKHEFELELG